MRLIEPEPDILVENRQRGHRVDTARCARLVAWLVRRARRIRPVDSPLWSSVTVLLVGDRGSAAAHRRVFDDPSVTDVITLSYADGPGPAAGLSGELIVNVARAHKEGSRRAAAGRRNRVWGPDFEFALYLAHGVDHLTGADDHEEADFLRMRSRELRWVAAAAHAELVSLFQ